MDIKATEMDISRMAFQLDAEKDRMKAIAKLYPSPQEIRAETEQIKGASLHSGQNLDIYA